MSESAAGLAEMIPSANVLLAEAPPPAAPSAPDDGTTEPRTPDATPDARDPSAPADRPDGLEDHAPPEGEGDTTPGIDYDPIVLKADGKEIPIPGSYETEDGYMVIPRETWDRTIARQFLADRHGFQQTTQELNSRIAQLQAQVNAPHPREAQVAELERRLMALVESPENLLEFADNWLQNKNQLLLEAENAALKQRLERGETPKPESNPEAAIEAEAVQIAQQLEPGLNAAVRSVIQELGAEAAGADAEAVFKLAWQTPEQFFFEAAEDMPEWGLRAGEIGVRLDLLEKLVQYDAGLRRSLTGNGAAAQRAAEVNAETLRRGRRGPPAGRPAAPPAPAPTNDKMHPADFRRAFLSGQFDD